MKRQVATIFLFVFFILYLAIGASAVSKPFLLTTWSNGQNCNYLDYFGTTRLQTSLNMPTGAVIENATVNVTGIFNATLIHTSWVNGTGENKTWDDCAGAIGTCAGRTTSTISNPTLINDEDDDTYTTLSGAAAHWMALFYIDYRLNSSLAITTLKMNISYNTTTTDPLLASVIFCNDGYSTYFTSGTVFSSITKTNISFNIPLSCIDNGHVRLMIPIQDAFSLGNKLSLREVVFYGTGNMASEENVWPGHVNVTLNNTIIYSNSSENFTGMARINLNFSGALQDHLKGNGTPIIYVNSSRSSRIQTCIENITYRQTNFSIDNVTYTNLVEEGGVNYTRNLNYTINYACHPASMSQRVDLIVDDQFRTTLTLPCSAISYTSTHAETTEGAKKTSFYLNITDDPTYNFYIGNTTHTWDLFNPTAIGRFNIPISSYTSTVEWQCNDSISPNPNYDYDFNGNNIETASFANTTLRSSSQPLIDGTNTLNGTCSDNFSTTYFTTSKVAVKFHSVNYSGMQILNGSNFTRVLYWTANLTCQPGDTTNLNTFIGETWEKNTPITCTGTWQEVNGFTVSTLEGNRTESHYLNDTTDPSQNTYMGNDTFYWDLYSPTIIFNTSTPVGFGSYNATLNLTCNDTAYTPLLYNLTVNGINIIYTNLTNHTLSSTSMILNQGANIILTSCSDLFSTITSSHTIYYFSKNLSLIDEKTGLDFDVSNISGVKAFFDDNSSYYDFKLAGNVSSVNFTSSTSTKLRIELTYLTGDIVIRYIDVSLQDTNNAPYSNETLRICANKEGITHYENILTSSRERGVALKNVFAQCLVAMDYTRFAYQDNKILKTYTIPATYDLFLYSNSSTRSKLASVDGSIATYIQIDIIEFSQSRTEVDSRGEAITFTTAGTNKIKIYYKNVPADSQQTTMQIYRMDTGSLLYTNVELTSPDEITYIFDYSLLSNVTNSTLFKAQVTRIDASGTSHTLKRYFDIHAKTGILVAAVGFVIALLLTMFGLTLSATRYTFGWFGMLILIASIGILSFSVQSWYVVFLEAINVVMMMFIGVIMYRTSSLQVT